VKGMEQKSMGAPSTTGMRPNNLRPTIDRVWGLEDQYTGHKTQRYGAGLRGERGLAPNDRWEIRGMGYTNDTVSPTQVAFMDKVRAQAIEKYNAAHPDLPPLDTLGGQELNWSVLRADSAPFNKAATVEEATRQAAQGIQTVAPRNLFQHSWETTPGANLGHAPEVLADPAVRGEYFKRMKGLMVDPVTGKDRLIGLMGGRMQEPTFEGPGIFKGELNPGVQSQSYVSHAYGQLDPASRARVNATEAMRAWMLGQDAYTGHLVTYPAGLKKSPGKIDTVQVLTGAGLPNELALDVQGIAGKTGGTIVPSEAGYRVLDIGDPTSVPGKNFAERFNAVAPELNTLTPFTETPKFGTRAGTSMYENMPWQLPDAVVRQGREYESSLFFGGAYSPSRLTRAARDAPIRQMIAKGRENYNALREQHGMPKVEDWSTPPSDLITNRGPGSGTKFMLAQLKSKDAPALWEYADSEATRTFMGNAAKEYESNPNITLPPGLLRGLKAWATGGLAEVQRLAKAGLVPAVIWSVLPEPDQTTSPASQ
jgi:hypothetical protein